MVYKLAQLNMSMSVYCEQEDEIISLTVNLLQGLNFFLQWNYICFTLKFVKKQTFVWCASNSLFSAVNQQLVVIQHTAEHVLIFVKQFVERFC